LRAPLDPGGAYTKREGCPASQSTGTEPVTVLMTDIAITFPPATDAGTADQSEHT
jgi:hypothetical protein